ncbi:MAG: hypothetical protein VB031_03670 [Eubacteriaceae bacterium]|nr:hypothetical protein [Eubacteriaceae bacterium]
MNDRNQASAQAAEKTRQSLYGSGAAEQKTENTQYQTYTPASGQVPPEVNKWNWGAFVFNMWWGIGNKTYLPLLCLIPLFNCVWVFICGAMGNKWAWEKGRFTSVEDFKAKQESWNRAGFVAFWVYIGLLVVYVIAAIALASWLSNYAYNPYNNYYNY